MPGFLAGRGLTDQWGETDFGSLFAARFYRFVLPRGDTIPGVIDLDF